MRTVESHAAYFWLLLPAVLVVFALLLWIRYRQNRIESMSPEAAVHVPPPESVVWPPRQTPIFVFDTTEIHDGQPATRTATPQGAAIKGLSYGAAVADAALIDAPMVAAAELLNPDVLDALSRWVNHGEAFSATQLFDYLHAHHDEIFSADTGPGFVTALQGFVGEQVAYHDLIAQGHSVYMPEITNVPNWDFEVDGQLFQEKIGYSALAHAKQAADAHPDIGIISDPVVAAHFADSIGLEHLDPDHLANITDQTLTGASTLASGPALHFPIFTILRVTFREIDLLSKNHTTTDAALKNAALDIGGVGGGLYAGGQLGLAIGAFFTPVGAAVGTVFGGALGALFGLFLSNGLKEKAFKRAIRDYETKRSEVEPVLEKARKSRQKAIRDYVKSRDESLTGALIQERRRLKNALRSDLDSIQVNRRAAFECFVLHLGRLKRLLRDGLRDFEKMHQGPWLRRTFVPKEGDVTAILARRWARNAEHHIDELRKDLHLLLASPEKEKWEEAARKISAFIREFECDGDSYFAEIRAAVTDVLAIKRQMDDRKREYDNTVRSCIVHAQREVNAFIDATHLLFTREIREIMKPVTDAIENIRYEGRRLGKSVP